MADRLTKERRSWNMSRIRGKHTSPEITVRKILRRLGYRLRLHVGNLPGKPDIVIPKYRAAIFVHGCFWHQHKGCKNCVQPKTNKEFWVKKFTGNVSRDRRNRRRLSRQGWKSIVIWECQIESGTFEEKLTRRVSRLVSPM